MSAPAIRNPDISLLVLLDGLATYYRRAYSYPSQEWLLRQLWLRYRARWSLRKLNYHLAALERAGLIRRKARQRRDAVLGHVFQSTLYRVTSAGLLRICGGHRQGQNSARGGAKSLIHARVQDIAHYLRTTERLSAAGRPTAVPSQGSGEKEGGPGRDGFRDFIDRLRR